MTEDSGRDDRSSYRQFSKTQHEEWSGVASADADFNKGARDLYETAGLDRKEWTILGFDAGSRRGRAWVEVFALNTALFGVTSHQELKTLGEAAALPVTKFYIPWESGLGDFIDEHFQSFTTSLTVKSMVGVDLQITDTKEIRAEQ
ncbi:hypothetical protein ABJI51_25695 [Amycolatopsis sp. NEAU-NG30]|uniref:Uncharacterized protein n=1 Tax=Amycolatopsis melonis TaxID=3156488 RepID=A0ABV0LJZ7_9PSEU